MLALIAAALLAHSAIAQFAPNSGPPRPPGSIPNAPGAAPPPPLPLPPAPVPDPIRPEDIQSQPLPPPPMVNQGAPGTPGAQGAPGGPGARIRPQQAAPGTQVPGAQTPTAQFPGAQLPGAPRPAPGAQPQPPNTPAALEEPVPEPPTPKIPNPTAVFSGLDKITGRITTFEVALNETVRFGALEVTPRVCYTRPPTELPQTDGFVEVDELTLQGELRRIFTGWMYAASPGLNAVEHPIYDVWLTDCKGAKPAVTAESPPETAPPQRTPARGPQRGPGAGRAPGLPPGLPPIPQGPQIPQR